MSDEQQIESLSSKALKPPAAAQTQTSGDPRPQPGGFMAKLRFFRAMLWVLVYACAGIFLMSVIILGGLRLQAKIIGGALLLALALIAASYGLQWHN
jgi:hypothetical protein